MTLLSNLKHTGRAAIIAVALGASSLTAAPALAQRGGGDGPSVNFSIELNGGYSQRRGGDFYLRCLTNRQIREELRDFGFRRIEIGRDLGRDRVEVFARYDGDEYSMRVNRCTGRVDRVRPLDW